ncbi:D-glucuronyl C5-epimerase family protein [Labilibaculum antarcticum]|uniref:D-glucuronyl C5-epimerase C-terminal domain-containing protein n=1 Tax=Labilibaculum antarcticum TaxID=1717717 RepID=A0A1Y1CE82_9BACT|nr:D-glucuronyl C5-epimerase family protein [Labilibaculum antarcticum]BAX78634.1 hypothetical protein ALGA_0239 [Labilibaculum antarcticum]
MNKDKLIYSFNRLLDEILDRPDYWHPRLKFRQDISYREYYYLDFSAKGNYPYELKDGIPLVEMNNVSREFSITILNYGLGLIDLYTNKHSDLLAKRIESILSWVLENQEKDGAWRNYYEVDFLGLKSGWTSAMGQGLAISFVYRCYNHGFLYYDVAYSVIDKAKSYMLTEDLNVLTDSGYVLQEFGGTSENVLNGFIFALYGIRDYCSFINDMSLFKQYVSTLKILSSKYNYFKIWSYYNTNKAISSSFYHQLHIEMMNSMFFLTSEKAFFSIAKRWELGKWIKLPFIVLKSTQKLINHNSITTLSS